MHSLLKRQLRKHLPDSLRGHPGMDSFLNAIDRSYANLDERAIMIQRATWISSEELYEANKKLREEAESQKKILETLGRTIETLDKNTSSDTNGYVFHKETFDPVKLAQKIERQAQEMARITKEKDSLLKSLERQNEALHNYAHMVSHDLKSPIRNVDALLTWLIEDQGPSLNEASKTTLDLVFENLAKIDALISGILMHASLDSIGDEKSPIDVNSLIDEIRNTIYVPKNVCIVKRGTLPIVMAHKHTLEQLFKNLMTNAITATENQDTGDIEITAIEEETHWSFSIKDNGKGIPEKHQSSIFDMFKKLENNSHATGIGLSLVKKIVNLYEGDICLASEEGKGTTFFFTLKK